MPIYTELWRTAAGDGSFRPDRKPLGAMFVFPGGRQALTCSLIEAGLTRSSRIAFPEWSSHCVLSALGKCATPVPMAEVVSDGLKVDAVMVYEQWGWRVAAAAWDELSGLMKKVIVIVDRVDSADFARHRSPLVEAFEIASLSKLLGLPGGGLCKRNSDYLEFKPGRMSPFTQALREDLRIDARRSPQYKDYFKGCDHAVHSEVLRWVSENCVEHALENENQRRQQNLRLLLDSPLSSDWPQWMAQAIEAGAGPGIAPIFRGRAKPELQTIMALLSDRFQLQSSIYNFNWSGNPVRPAYEACLAVPMHGMVENIEETIHALCHQFKIRS